MLSITEGHGNGFGAFYGMNKDGVIEIYAHFIVDGDTLVIKMFS